MPQKVILDPLTRIEGHLGIEAVVDNGRVVDARCSGTLYRGFEQILIGRDPLDAVQITQRFCGVCPAAHALASAQCLDNALGLVPPHNGRVIRNLIQGANYIQSHILHFYHLAALDYARGPEFPPFIPRFEADYRLPAKVSQDIVSHYVQALHIRLKAHEMSAVFSGKMPHCASVVPGGVTVTPAVDKVTTFLWRLKELREFIDNVYIPDVLTIAAVYRDYSEIGRGCRRFLSYGAFDLDSEPDVQKRTRFFQMGRVVDGRRAPVDPGRITEDVRHAWYRERPPAHPSRETTEPDRKKAGGYSWLKAPRYEGLAYEVGPLARAMVNSADNANPALAKALDGALAQLRLRRENLCSVMGRHLARALETKVLADAMADWVLQIKLDEPVAVGHKLPEAAAGMGLWDAPRGALGHWISIRNQKIERYQAVVPTTWNASPHDGKEQPGPIEEALLGAPVEDPANPFALARIVRSFDPCIACAVHLVTPRGRLLASARIV
ncbi:MAG: iron hydrogenase [Bryobacteraceae bacterium]|nr:MAG: iron hydrogenase [Bryobacteraceae bacterium]